MMPAYTDAESDAYSSMDEDELVREIWRAVKEDKRHMRKWRFEAVEDFDFYAGDQWDDEDRAILAEQMRPCITFNRTQPMVDAVVGSEVNNRQEVRYIPREIGDAAVNELLTNAAKWARDNCDAEDEESDAFLDCIICGMGWTETRIDYDEDHEGKLIIERIDPLEMGWDHTAKKKNLADARHIWREKDVPRAEFKELWPKAWSRVLAQGDEMAIGYDHEGTAELHDATEAWQYKNDQSGEETPLNSLRVLEWQCWKRKKVYRTVNPQTGKEETISEKAYKKIGDTLARMGIPVVVQYKRVYEKVFLCGRVVLESSNGAVDGFTYNCITGKRDRNRNTWSGLVRNMKDPQRWANKFFSQILHTVNTQAKGGLIAEQSVFIDQRVAEEEWAKPDSIVYVQDGAVSGGRLIPKPVGAYPTGTDRLMQFAIGSLREVTGVNIEMLGMADREQAGVLEQQRKQAGLTILATMFDSLRRYRKIQGRVLLQFITRYLSDGRLIRIDGTMGPQYVQLARQPDTIEYDVIVDDSPTSPNQKEMVWAILAPLLPQLVKVGLPMPPDLLDYLPIPASLAAKWKQVIQQAQQQGGGQDPKAQAEAEKTKAEIEKVKTQTEGIKQKAQADMQKTAIEMQVAKMKAETEQVKAGVDIQVRQQKARADITKANVEAQLAPVEAEAGLRHTERMRQMEALGQSESLEQRRGYSEAKTSTEKERGKAIRRKAAQGKKR